MPVGISFGAATSGNGFDVASTVSSIMAVARTPETAWATRTTALTAQDTVLTSLGSDVAALSTALSTLTSFDGVFAQKQGASSNTTAVALTSVGSTAQTGSHSLTVSRLATTAQQYSSAVGSGATLSGSLTLQTAGASSATTFTIAADSTPAQVAAQINQGNAGVHATLLSDSNGQHLSLTSSTSGAAGDLTVRSSATDSEGNSLSFTASQAGTDAAYTLDGVALTSGSNTIASALTGIAFTLTGTATDAVTLQVAPNQDGIATALQNFVAAYNTLTKALTAQEGKDSSGNAQPLYGSTVISEIQSHLSNAFAFAPVEDGSNGLAMTALGLSLSLDGTLALDTGTLRTELSQAFDRVATSFQQTGSFGQSFSSTLNTVGSIGTGSLALALGNNGAEEKTLTDNKTALEARLSAYQTRLTAELNTANEILQAIPQQLNQVNQMFYAISGYKSS